jgi:hypothetical protein
MVEMSSLLVFILILTSTRNRAGVWSSNEADYVR